MSAGYTGYKNMRRLILETWEAIFTQYPGMLLQEWVGEMLHSLYSSVG